MIKNLVIGSEGFIGKSLCTYLEKKGEQVTHFDIKRNKEEDARVAILPLHKFDRVYFLAWEVGGAKYLYRNDTQLHQLNWNVELLKNVMTQLQKSKIPFVFVSSQLAEETDSIYGATKKLGELWTQQLKGSCVRLWNVYGVQEETSERSHVVSDFIHQATTTNKIKIMGTGEEKRQFIHTNDVCEGLHHVLENNLNEEIYDLTSFEWITIRDIANLIGAYTNAKIILGAKKETNKSATTLKGKPPRWTPRITLKEGIKKMIDEITLSTNKDK
mgnify:CR=1 FL=1